MLLFLLTSVAFADTETATETAVLKDYSNNIVIVKVAFVCDDTDGVCATELVNINGFILNVDTNPGSPGPSDGVYDITLIDSISGVDVMGGELSNRSATANESVFAKRGNGYGAVYTTAVTITPINNSVNDAVFDVYITISTMFRLSNWN